MFKADTNLDLLGIRVDYQKLKTVIAEGESNISTIRKLIETDYALLNGEHSVISGAIKSLYEFACSGKKKSKDISVGSKVDDLYILFFSSCLHNQNADKLFDWLLLQNWGVVVGNTIKYHLNGNKLVPPLDYPHGTFFRYVALAMINNPNASPNARKEKH
ncbi:hypothetical protein SDC9_198753 [bioreactor metagenome]|uniref:Uncharacterized protein n=1 Tax=bioreactor metagenome TaxID=1076179 RepID=A0A645IIJ8_9ZZZZ